MMDVDFAGHGFFFGRVIRRVQADQDERSVGFCNDPVNHACTEELACVNLKVKFARRHDHDVRRMHARFHLVLCTFPHERDAEHLPDVTMGKWWKGGSSFRVHEERPICFFESTENQFVNGHEHSLCDEKIDEKLDFVNLFC